MNKKAKLAVIGDKDSVMVFKSLGFKTVYAEEKKSIESTINSLSKENYEVIYITEQAAILVPEILDAYKNVPFPTIIPIPNRFGSIGLGKKRIRENIEKAIGADIL